MENINRALNVKEILKDGIVIPAIPLALKNGIEFDEKTQRLLVNYYLNSGAKGIAFAVHTTQFEIRDYPEIYDFATKVVIDEIKKFEKENKDIIVKICGISGDLSNALEESKKAKLNGYDVLLLSPLAFSKENNVEGLIKYYTELSNIMPIFGFYLQKSVGGMNLPYEFWERVFELKNLIGVKIAPFNRYETIDVLKAAANSSRYDDIAIYTGNDDHIVFDLISEYEFETKYGKRKIEFAGGLLGQWSIWTKKAVDTLTKIKEEKKSGFISNELITEGLKLTEANAAIFDVENDFKGSIAGIHEVLRLEGFFDEIFCFADNGVLSNNQAKKIKYIVDNYPELSDSDFVKAFLNNN